MYNFVYVYGGRAAHERDIAGGGQEREGGVVLQNGDVAENASLGARAF